MFLTTFITEKKYRSFKTHKALFTQIQVLQYSELVEFNIGIYVCIRACVCIGVSNAKHGMGHALSVRVIHKKSSEVHKHNLTSIKFLFYSDETINTGMLH